jgi:hypothetical protein
MNEQELDNKAREIGDRYAFPVATNTYSDTGRGLTIRQYTTIQVLSGYGIDGFGFADRFDQKRATQTIDSILIYLARQEMDL